MDYRVEQVKQFVTAGRALFTIKNEESGGRFTFKVKQPDRARDFWFVSVLDGPDNYSNYKYIGSIFSTDFRRTTKSRVSSDSPCFKAFKWFWKRVVVDQLPEKVSVYHEGRCGRCGRRLTVPESIQSGFGPECITRV